ncbi:MAG: hypothetical protein Q8P67_12335 [archaeon]|nr:hypothetical protein [archaeon]
MNAASVFSGASSRSPLQPRCPTHPPSSCALNACIVSNRIVSAGCRFCDASTVILLLAIITTTTGTTTATTTIKQTHIPTITTITAIHS